MSYIKVLCIIISCQKNKHLWQKIKQEHKSDCIIVFATESTQTSFYHLENGILELKCNDLYEGLPEKIICAIDAILTDMEFKDVTHILKIDDHDNVFSDDNVQFLKTKLNDPDSLIYGKDYIGQRLQKKSIAENNMRYRTAHFKKVSHDCQWSDKPYTGTYVDFIHGGCSYVLSRKAMEHIHRTYSHNNISLIRTNEIFEDLMIAKILANNGILPTRFIYGVKGDKPNTPRPLWIKH